MNKMLLTAMLASVSFTGFAHASPFTFDVWTGSSINDILSKKVAAPPIPTGMESANFSYSGMLDFNNTGSGSNTFGDFFHNSGGIDVSGGITGFNSPRGLYSTFAEFLGATMSVSGDGSDTFIRITGLSVVSGTVLSITHDDGGTIYMSGSQICGNPAEAVVSTETCTIVASGATTIYYAEDNGAPAILKISVPEPGSLAILGVGLLGLGMVARRRA